MIAFRQEYASLKQQTGIMNSEHLTKDFKAKMDAGDKQLEHAIVDSSPYRMLLDFSAHAGWTEMVNGTNMDLYIIVIYHHHHTI